MLPVSLVRRALLTGRVPHLPGGDHRKDLEEKQKHEKEPREKAGDQYQFVRRGERSVIFQSRGYHEEVTINPDTDVNCSTDQEY